MKLSSVLKRIEKAWKRTNTKSVMYSRCLFKIGNTKYELKVFKTCTCMLVNKNTNTIFHHNHSAMLLPSIAAYTIFSLYIEEKINLIVDDHD